MLKSIQVCRGLAALLVAHVHATVMARVYAERYGSLDAISNSFYHVLDFGQLGVDLFFVISGFIMIFVTDALPPGQDSVRAFLERRIARIVPLYWLFTFLLAALILLAPGVVVHDDLSPSFFLKSLFFIPVVRSNGEIAPLVPPGWTLNFEMFFYLCLGALLFLPARHRVWPLSLGFAALAGAGLAWPPGPNRPIASLLTSPLLLEFLYGCWLGTLVRTGRVVGPSWAALCVLLGAGGIVANLFLSLQAYRPFSWGIPSALLIYGLLCMERANKLRFPRLLVRIGDASYSLYLVHWFVLPPLGRAWAKSGVGNRLPGDVLVALGIVASVGGAFLVHRYLEEPLIRRARRLLLRRSALANLEPGGSGVRTI